MKQARLEKLRDQFKQNREKANRSFDAQQLRQSNLREKLEKKFHDRSFHRIESHQMQFPFIRRTEPDNMLHKKVTEKLSAAEQKRIDYQKSVQEDRTKKFQQVFQRVQQSKQDLDVLNQMKKDEFSNKHMLKRLKSVDFSTPRRKPRKRDQQVAQQFIYDSSKGDQVMRRKESLLRSQQEQLRQDTEQKLVLAMNRKNWLMDSFVSDYLILYYQILA